MSNSKDKKIAKEDMNVVNEKLNKIIAYKNIDQVELKEHLYLIKKWLREYNQFEYDNQSLGKFTKYIKKVEEIKIVLNHKLNFCRTKILIDYLELKKSCPSLANEFRINFIKYISYVNALVRRILISSKKILEDTSVFNDLILFNFPYNYSFNNEKNNYYELIKSERGIISFSKCFVVSVNSPIFLLWAKKEYPVCSCEQDDKKYYNNKKYFNIFSQNIKNNSNFSKTSICNKCGKAYYHDTKGDIYIQSQKIKLSIECKNRLLPNVISVWSFGDLINSVEAGDCITLNAFHVPEKLNVFEKDYANGYYVALNYDRFFNNLYLLKPSDFGLNLNNAQDNLAEKLKNIKLKENKDNNDIFDNILFDNEDKLKEENLEEIVQSLRFQKQTCESFYKLIIQNYINFKQKELDNLDSGYGNNSSDTIIFSPKINEIYYPFINLILDISITQRDYYNHHIKLCFFENSIENENNDDEEENSQESNHLREITQSRNILFKKNIFNKKDSNNKKINISATNKFDKLETSSTLDLDIQNYFELIHQNNNTSNLGNDLLTRPIHLFLIFDSVKNDPLFNNIILKYATKLYPSLISIFPVHNQVKWNQTELMNYFYSNNNSIILIQDIELLSKLEIEVINSIININNNNSLNITFWFCCSFSLLSENNNNINNKNNKINGNNYLINNNMFNNNKIKIKGFENILDKCEIIMNYSIRNLNFINNISLINNNSIINYLMDNNEGVIKEDKILEFYHYSDFVSNKMNIYCNKNHLYNAFDNSSLNSSKIIEKYFIYKRNISKINFDDLFTLLRFSIFFSMLRFHYEKKKISIPITISNINYIDALYSILIYEHISQFKYGIEKKIMANITESLIFQDYNLIIDEIMNNIMLEEQNTVIKNKINNNNIFRDDIPSKSLNNKRIKLDDNVFNTNNDNNMILNMNVMKESRTDIGCKLCKQINKLNVEHKKYLLDYLNKLNEFILRDFNN